LSDFRIIKRLISGGHTLVAPNPFTPNVLPGAAQALQTRRVRFINIDYHILKRFNPDGTPVIDWSASGVRLDSGLAIATQHGWFPRIVWGLNPPDPLMTLNGLTTGGAHRSYGPGEPTSNLSGLSGWALYDNYTMAMLEYVLSRGLTHFEIEVGNEFNSSGNASIEWFVPDNSPPGTRGVWWSALDPYVTLYTHVANVVNKFNAGHQGVVQVEVGGPAATDTSFSNFWKTALPACSSLPVNQWLVNETINGEQTTRQTQYCYFNFIEAFIDRVVRAKAPLDFVSWHTYDHGGDGSFSQSVSEIQSYLRSYSSLAKIHISEWGADALGSGINTNAQTVAGAYALDFLYDAEQAGLDEALFLTLSPSNPNATISALYYLDKGSKEYNATHAMTAMSELMEVAAQTIRLTCSASSSLHCYASYVPALNEVRIMLWGYNVESQRLGNQPFPMSGVTVDVLGLPPGMTQATIQPGRFDGYQTLFDSAKVSLHGTTLRIENLALTTQDYLRMTVEVR
jgi:hypothetical protein